MIMPDQTKALEIAQSTFVFIQGVWLKTGEFISC